MRLMCSQNQAEVDLVKNELLKAGIPSETRSNPVANALGLSGLELWVQDERDFYEASNLYARLQDRPPRRSGANGAGAPAKPAETVVPEASPEQAGAHEPREELKLASSLLEKGIEQMLRRESELTAECAMLRSKVDELNQALSQRQIALAHETESRIAAERNQAEQISGLMGAIEQERTEWQQQLKSREDSLAEAREKLDSMSESLQSEQATVAGLKQEIAKLEARQRECEKSLAEARAEMLAEREARVAAEQRADKAAQAQKSLHTELLHRRDLEQKMQAHVASLTSLFGTLEEKRKG